jgi:N-acetylglutamate synthase/N-acetylornithine aminotransferase
MTDDRKKELQALKDDYRRLLAKSGEANECGNYEGMISAQRMMAANVSRQIVLTEIKGVYHG